MKIYEYRISYDNCDEMCRRGSRDVHIDANVSAEEARLIDEVSRKGIPITIRPATRLASAFSDDIFYYCHNDIVTQYRVGIKKVIFHNPATIVLWSDGTKTVVKCQEGDIYDPEKGFALCCAKKLFSNQSNFNNVFKKWIKEG